MISATQVGGCDCSSLGVNTFLKMRRVPPKKVLLFLLIVIILVFKLKFFKALLESDNSDEGAIKTIRLGKFKFFLSEIHKNGKQFYTINIHKGSLSSMS